MCGTGIPGNLEQDSQGDKKEASGDNSERDLDDFVQQFDTNTKGPLTVVTIRRSSRQRNARDHADLEESSHEISTSKGKTTYNQTPENIVFKGNVCDLCGKSFAHENVMKRHKRRTHGEGKTHFCQKCTKGFYRNCELSRHIATVHKEEDKGKKSSLAGNTVTQQTKDNLQNFCNRTDDKRCSICQKEFTRRCNLVKHIKYVHRNGDGVQLNCTWPGCSKTFNRKTTLDRHLSRHKNSDKNFHCNVCGSSFKSTDGYSRHMEMHKNKDGGVSYPCQTCSKVFHHTYLLKQHEQSHKTSTFVCDFCGKSFAFQALLNKHRRRLHTKEKTYFCTKCPESFYVSKDLTNHMAMLHEGHDLNITCHVCGKSVRRTNIKHHVKTVHSKRDREECPLCGKDFKCHQYLNDHINEIHGNRSGKEFVCTWPNCDKSFIRKRELKQHLDVHNDVRPHSCQICFKKFRAKSHLKVHMDWHNGVRAHQCQLCESAFLTKGNLTKHMASHAKVTNISAQLPENDQSDIKKELALVTIKFE